MFRICHIYACIIMRKQLVQLLKTATMKVSTILAIAFIFTLISLSMSDRIDPNYSYQDFYRNFNRTYEDEQKKMHEQNFNQNYRELLNKIQNGEDVKINNFLDWNATQLQSFFNYRPQSLGRPITPKPLKSSLFLSPSSFDWRNAGRITPIKDQQFCGSCWSFATTAQYQSLLAIQTNGTIYDLSEQYAIECQRVSSNGCNGGYPLAALQLFNSTGIPLQTSYPYQPDDQRYYSTRGKAICTDANRIKLAVNTTRLMHYNNLTTQQIQDQLTKSGPLTVAVYANHPAFQYVGSSGLINNCPTDGGPDHAVLLVGYNSTHWFIKNSWGPYWGHNGYGYILKTNDCKLSTWVDVMNIQSGSTPTPTPGKDGYAEYNITMTDSKGDGWNGNILAFKQDGYIVATFGQGFSVGSSYGPQTVRIKNNVQTQIVVAQKGNYTNQVGFTIKNSAGTVIISRTPGNTYDVSIIFKTFCPISNCIMATTVDYTVSMTDAYGDGWNGVVLGFRQNGITQNFGQSFTNGAQFPNTIYTFQKSKNVDIIVTTPGLWTEQIGFIVRNRQGYVVFQRASGTSFDANAILGSFCPQCLNLSPVRVVGNVQVRQDQTKIAQSQTDSSNQIVLQKLLQRQQSNYETMKRLMIATMCLAGIVLLLLVILCLTMMKNKTKNNVQINRIPDTARNSQKSVNSEAPASSASDINRDMLHPVVRYTFQ